MLKSRVVAIPYHHESNSTPICTRRSRMATGLVVLGQLLVSLCSLALRVLFVCGGGRVSVGVFV